MGAALLYNISQNPDEQAKFRARRKFQQDMENELAYAREASRLNVAQNIRYNGLDWEIISLFTGIPIETLKEKLTTQTPDAWLLFKYSHPFFLH
ncbi:MAG: hypothetical protein LBS62_02545 [Clostridiales bacterium]|nr:hypothetical protein [Clostridiales bacterium]